MVKEYKGYSVVDIQAHIERLYTNQLVENLSVDDDGENAIKVEYIYNKNYRLDIFHNVNRCL